MQATETSQAVDEAVVAPEIRPDLDMSQYVPDFLQPFWDVLAPYPGLLTLFLVVLSYALGKLLTMVLTRALTKITSKTATEADDLLVVHLSKPIVLTTVTLALMMVVSVFQLPQGLQDATLSVLATVILFSWVRAGLRAARIVLELIGSNHHRFEIVQERTIPIFDMTIKMLLVGFGAYAFLMIWGINATAWRAAAGVIGIAVGFAAKDTLANLFSGVGSPVMGSYSSSLFAGSL